MRIGRGYYAALWWRFHRAKASVAELRSLHTKAAVFSAAVST